MKVGGITAAVLGGAVLAGRGRKYNYVNANPTHIMISAEIK